MERDRVKENKVKYNSSTHSPLSYSQKDFFGIDVSRVVKGKIVDEIDDIVVTTLDNKYSENGMLLEKKFGIYGEYLDYRKTVFSEYYYKTKDRLIFIEMVRQTKVLDELMKYYWLFKRGDWLERNGFYDGKRLSIYFLMIFRRTSQKQLFVTEWKREMIEFLSKKMKEDLPFNPFIFYQSKIDKDEWLKCRKMIELITI